MAYSYTSYKHMTERCASSLNYNIVKFLQNANLNFIPLCNLVQGNI